MEAPYASGMTEIKDFSKARKRLRFRVDDDVFEATPAIPAEVMIQFAEKFSSADPSKMSVADQLLIFREMLETVVLPGSMTRLRERMSDSANPVDMDQLDAIVSWLFEEYGMRPTEASSASSSGDALPETGTTSTESTLRTELISAASLSTDS